MHVFVYVISTIQRHFKAHVMREESCSNFFLITLCVPSYYLSEHSEQSANRNTVSIGHR